MFFYAAKLGWFVAQPLVAILLGFLGALLATLAGWRRTAAAFACLSVAALAIAALSPLGPALMNMLENRFERPDTLDRVDGIVVLGGSFDTAVARTRGVAELNDAGDRVTTALALARRFPQAEVIFSGGMAGVFAEDIAEADLAATFMGNLGLAPDRLRLDSRARDTYENAVFTRGIAKPEAGETWLLITSAYHMPRAVGCFRKAGFAITPFPADYSTKGGPEGWNPSSSTIRNLEKLHFGLREFLGLAAYYATGRIETPFPAPERP